MIALRLGLKYELRKKALDQSLSVMSKMDISEDLRLKIFNFITNIYPTLSSQEEFERLCHYISPVLQKQVMEYVYQPIFTSNYLFDDDEKLSKFIINRVNYKFYQPEQDIITEGTRASDFYFLVKGTCSVYVKSKEEKKKLVCHLTQGTHFGEIGLIYKTYRTATVSSHEYSTVAHLCKDEFRILTNAFPYIIDKLKLGLSNYKDPWKNFILSIFRQTDIFDILPDDVFEELMYKMKIIKLQKGDYLFKQGEYMKGMYGIASGVLELNILLNDSQFHIEEKKMTSIYSIHDTEIQDKEKVLVNISLLGGKTMNAEVIPVLTEETDEGIIKQASPCAKEVQITALKQGTLLYPLISLKKGQIHKLQCKVIENSILYLLDKDIIKFLCHEYDDFKKISLSDNINDYLEFYNSEGIKDYFKHL